MKLQTLANFSHVGLLLPQNADLIVLVLIFTFHLKNKVEFSLFLIFPVLCLNVSYVRKFLITVLLLCIIRLLLLLHILWKRT